MARLAEGQYIKMRKATEDMILKSTKDEFIRFILENAVVEEDEDEEACFIPSGEHEFVWGKTYEMQGEEFKGDEFIITNDGRVFFALSLNTNWEVVDDVKKETKDETHPTLYWVKKGDRAVRCESKEAAFEAYVRMGKTEVTIEKHFWDSDVEGRMKEYTLTFTGTAHWEVDTTKQFWNGRWGREQTRDVYLHKFKDEHGNIFTWKTSDPLGYWDEHGQWVHIDEGTQVTIKGTVKEHSEYKGIKQTVLTRCKVA